jgi:hypothetical protein
MFMQNINISVIALIGVATIVNSTISTAASTDACANVHMIGSTGAYNFYNNPPMGSLSASGVFRKPDETDERHQIPFNKSSMDCKTDFSTGQMSCEIIRAYVQSMSNGICYLDTESLSFNVTRAIGGRMLTGVATSSKQCETEMLTINIDSQKVVITHIVDKDKSSCAISTTPEFRELLRSYTEVLTSVPKAREY